MQKRYAALLVIVSMIGNSDIIAASTTPSVSESKQGLFSDSMLGTLPSLNQIDQDLIGLVQDLTYGKTPEQIVSALVHFYAYSEMPLAKAAIQLIHQKSYVSAAIDIAQLLVDALPINSPDAYEINAWISDLNVILSGVEYVLFFIKGNPQLVAMIVK